MNKKKIFSGLKILVILFLVMAISFLVIMQWKSNVIISKVVLMIQNQMQDSMRYDDISLEWLRYFPSAALELDGLRLGSGDHSFIEGGNVDVVLRLFPLLKERIVINKLMISNSTIHISKHKGRWSYDLFKKQEKQLIASAANVATKTDSTAWEALVKELSFENTLIKYDNDEGISFSLNVNEGRIKGDITGELFDAEIEMIAQLEGLKMKEYIQAQPFPFEMSGKYKYDAKAGYQELKNWQIQNNGIELEASGIIRREENHRWMDIHVAWMDANPQVMKALLPAQEIKNWNAYTFSGKSEGQLDIKGISSEKESPHITFSSELKNGSIKFPGEGGHLKSMLLNLAYDNGESKSKKDSYFRANLRSGSFQGNSLKANMQMENLLQPIMDLEITGNMPAGILNLFMDSTAWNFKKGDFDIDHYEIRGLNIKNISTKTLIEKSVTDLTSNHVLFNYNSDEIEIIDGDFSLNEAGQMKLKADEFIWNKAKGEDIIGELVFAEDKVDFKLSGNHCRGEVYTEGTLSGFGAKPVLNADWRVKGIEMKEMLASFENFGQAFITSENLEGKADIWTHTSIPYDAAGNIRQRDVVVRAAIEIKDGELKDLKTLEDFSKYVHLDDLRYIKFNQFRNYMKIEDGRVYMPVIFLQSSAINLSVNGVHSFDHEILYNLKINAGQAAANKLKKIDLLKKLKQARKSGWINLYYVLSGTVGDVKYDQDQKQVISAFEQSSQLKENLRNYLVDRFGHDVYWLEPNEWEDIPEYK